MKLLSVKHRLTDVRLMSILAPSTYRPTPERVAACAAAYQQDPQAEAYACQIDGVDVELIIFTVEGHEAVIQRIATDSAFRGQGIGRLMIDRIMALFHLTALEAKTDDDAVGFYRQCGFSITRRDRIEGNTRYLCRKVR